MRDLMNLFSRREVVGSLGAGLMTVAAAPVFAQTALPATPQTTAHPMQDPISK
ncbi:hypothetical protein [Bradyrhizobium sp. URHC0002]|jgi:hypothetical protein